MAEVARLLETLRPMREPPPPQPILPFVLMTLAGCLVAAVVAAAVWQARRRSGALRRAAEAALACSRTLEPRERLAAQALLLRRIVRTLLGDDEARTQGNAWLASLDRVFDTTFFTDGAGRAYADALYRPEIGADVDGLDRSLSGFLAKVRT